jgi:tRNA(adenine34) deaminase
MKNFDTYWMRIALEQAALALHEDELPVGAAVVVGEMVIGVGRKFRGGQFRLDHAEMVALREVLTDHEEGFEGLTLYTTLEPCMQCFGAALNAKLGRIVYALVDPYGGATRIPRSTMPIRHREEFPDIVSGVLREESRQLLEQFFRTTKNRFWSTAVDNPLYQLCVS